MVETPQGPGWWPDAFDPFARVAQPRATQFTPRADAKAGDDAYRITLELPGIPREAIEISLQDGVLAITGEKTAETVSETEGYFFSERHYGRFQRSFRLPADAEPGSISASLTDGVLVITVPKRAPDLPKPQRIEIGG